MFCFCSDCFIMTLQVSFVLYCCLRIALFLREYLFAVYRLRACLSRSKARSNTLAAASKAPY